MPEPSTLSTITEYSQTGLNAGLLGVIYLLIKHLTAAYKQYQDKLSELMQKDAEAKVKVAEGMQRYADAAERLIQATEANTRVVEKMRIQSKN